MISNNDRSGYFGASDTSMVVASSRTTKSFKQWWAVKMGDMESDFKGSWATDAGNRYEHPILDSISEKIMKDRQIIIEPLKLRVNYDGDLRGTIYEVKTYRSDKVFAVSKAYWRQAQVEMYAYKEMQEELKLPPFKKLYIVSYPLYPDEYNAQEITIDPSRLRFEPINYDKTFIKEQFLPEIKHLARCLKKRKMP